MRVSTFTDTYLPTINGATYTINLWKQKWNEGWGEMTVTYPASRGYDPEDDEYPVRSLPFPFYDDIKLALPLPSGLSGLFRVLTSPDSSHYPDTYLGYTSSLKDSLVEDSYLEKGIEGQRRALGTVPSLRKDNDKGFVLPDAVRDADVVHVHGPFSMGMAGASLATSEDIPLVVNYHTPTDEYVKYITQNDRLEKQLKAINNWWERKYLDKADMVVTPSEQARSWLDEKGVESDKVRVLRNGIDVEFFSPTDPSEFRDEHDLDGLTVGYCGRHGYEKDLTDVIDAAARLEDVDVVLVGDGPAREDLIEYAEEVGADNVVLPGFLERERLPEFYSSLDAFVFPSDSETEGLVALEATACGTPVVAADARGLKNTVKHGENGYRYPPGDIDALVSSLERVLENRERLSHNCIEMRDSIKVDSTLEKLDSIYSEVV